MPTQDRPSTSSISNLKPGKDASTSKNRYQAGPIFQYPVDLNNNELKHYITFELVSRGKSEAVKGKKVQEIRNNPDSANLSREQLSGLGTGAVGAGAVTSGGAVYALTKKLFDTVGKTGDQQKGAPGVSIPGVVAGGVAGVAVGKAMADFLTPDVKYKLEQVIALYVDGPPTVRYGMNYTNKELGNLAGLIGGAIGDTYKNLNSAEALSAIGLQAAKLPGIFSGVDISTAAQKGAGVALNPFKEVVFVSVDFRTFQFKYRFFPRSPEESRRAKDIISLFKYHMHPEMSDNRLFFKYPSEFIITYNYNSGRNTYFHKFANCVLETMDLSYGGEQFSSFSDGSPTEINMSLTFREIELLTKKMIDQGY